MFLINKLVRLEIYYSMQGAIANLLEKKVDLAVIDCGTNCKAIIVCRFRNGKQLEKILGGCYDTLIRCFERRGDWEIFQSNVSADSLYQIILESAEQVLTV